ncbi:hypothetical protein [Algoriella sp.]|uniref:hypothetical protein n=1 Tax=Algoriella sp. TaxID=1872434 RepID=UPI002FCC9E36
MKKILIIILITLITLFGFYKFMTYDRNYSWSKKIEESVEYATKNTKFTVQKIEKIEVEKIKLPLERHIKIRIQKALNKVGLMSYGTEFGTIIYLVSDKPNEVLKVKSWCLSDHIIGIEISEQNIDNESLKEIRRNFETEFNNYKIVWSKF